VGKGQDEWHRIVFHYFFLFHFLLFLLFLHFRLCVFVVINSNQVSQKI
jgi:hypothetical protein